MQVFYFIVFFMFVAVAIVIVCTWLPIGLYTLWQTTRRQKWL